MQAACHVKFVYHTPGGILDLITRFQLERQPHLNDMVAGPSYPALPLDLQCIGHCLGRKVLQALLPCFARIGVGTSGIIILVTRAWCPRFGPSSLAEHAVIYV